MSLTEGLELVTDFVARGGKFQGDDDWLGFVRPYSGGPAAGRMTWVQLAESLGGAVFVDPEQSDEDSVATLYVDLPNEDAAKLTFLETILEWGVGFDEFSREYQLGRSLYRFWWD